MGYFKKTMFLVFLILTVLALSTSCREKKKDGEMTEEEYEQLPTYTPEEHTADKDRYEDTAKRLKEINEMDNITAEEEMILINAYISAAETILNKYSGKYKVEGESRQYRWIKNIDQIRDQLERVKDQKARLQEFMDESGSTDGS